MWFSWSDLIFKTLFLIPVPIKNKIFLNIWIASNILKSTSPRKLNLKHLCSEGLCFLKRFYFQLWCICLYVWVWTCALTFHCNVFLAGRWMDFMIVLFFIFWGISILGSELLLQIAEKVDRYPGTGVQGVGVVSLPWVSTPNN